MNRTSLRFLLAMLLCSVVPLKVVASSSTVMGKTDAQRCYQESQVVLSMSGIRYCNDALDDGDLTRRDLAATHSNRGLIFAGNGELEKALADQNRSIEILPTLPQAYINRGNVYHHMKRYEDALADYRRAVSLLESELPVPHYNAGLTLLRLKRMDEALAAFRRALEINPDSRTIREKIEYIEKLGADDSELDEAPVAADEAAQNTDNDGT